MANQTLKKKLNKQLILRDKLFPNRETINTTQTKKYMNLYIKSLHKKKDNKRYQINNTNKYNRFINSPVFICGEMKSGTTLLTELLDGHPKLLVLPGDSHFINWINNNNNIISKIDNDSGSKLDGQLKNWDSYWLSRLINPKGQKPYWIFGEDEPHYIEFLNSINYWIKKLPKSRLNAFKAVVISYYESNPHLKDNIKYWIEKTPRNENHVESLLTHFPKAKFIHIIRNPLENITSLKRLYQFRNWPWDIKKIISNFKKSDKTIERNKRIVGKSRYLVIHYENLTGKPKSTMKEISNFLDIEFSKQLLIPLINGIKTKANSMYKDRQIIGVIRNNNSNKWKKYLSIREKAYIYYILNNTAKRLNYEWEGDPLCKHINRIKNIFHLY